MHVHQSCMSFLQTCLPADVLRDLCDMYRYRKEFGVRAKIHIPAEHCFERVLAMYCSTCSLDAGQSR